jgi:hypothetical protein
MSVEKRKKSLLNVKHAEQTSVNIVAMLKQNNALNALVVVKKMVTTIGAESHLKQVRKNIPNP